MKNLIKIFIVFFLLNLNSLNASEAGGAKSGDSKATAEQIASFEQQLEAQVAALEQQLETIKIFHDHKIFTIVVMANYGSNARPIEGKNIYKKVSIYEIEAYSKQYNLPLTSVYIIIHPIHPSLHSTAYYYRLFEKEFFDSAYKEKLTKTLCFMPTVNEANKLELNLIELIPNNAT